MMKKQKEQEEHIAGLLKKLNKEKESKDNITKEAIGAMEKQLKNAMNQNMIIKDGLAKKKGSIGTNIKNKVAGSNTNNASNNNTAKQSISKVNTVVASKSTNRTKSPNSVSQITKIKLENLNDNLYNEILTKQKEQEEVIKKQLDKIESDNSGKDFSTQIEDLKVQMQLVTEANKILTESKNSYESKQNNITNNKDNSNNKKDVASFVKQAIQSKLFVELTNKLNEQEQRTLDMITHFEKERSSNSGNIDESNDKIAELTKQLELVQ